MFRLKRLIGGSVLVFILAGAALAQENRAPVETPREAVPAAPLVTAAANGKRVRFVSPGTVVQLRLEIFNDAGQKLFDTELRGGNVLDWHLQDGAGQRLPAGSYACVLTIKSLSGRLSQRVGVVTVNDEKGAVETAGIALSPAQQQTIGPVEANAAFTIVQESETEAITAVTHDGNDGQITSTRGALSFRLGDVFAGKDKEQMRLTEEGNLGLGTSEPKAKLDVAGTIRAERVLIARPKSGSDQGIATGDTSLAAQAAEIDQPLVAGTGTQNKIAKWTDGAGTLGDSVITELGGNLGIGTATPASLLHLAGPGGVSGITLNTPGTHRFRFQTLPGIVNWGALTLNANYNFPSGWVLDDAATNGWFFKLDNRGGNNSGPLSGLWLYRVPPGAGAHTDEVPMFGVSSAHAFFDGNVGIGTNNPTAKLDVAGIVNTATQYNIGGNRVLAVTGSNNTFTGSGAGVNNIGSGNSFFGSTAGAGNTGSQNSFFGSNAGISNSGTNNSFFGSIAGLSNRGNNNSFFGYQAGFGNTMGAANSFFGINAGVNNQIGSSNSFFGINAGDSNTEGNNNSFFGRDSGEVNTTGDENTVIGAFADVGSGDLFNATAIGQRALVSQSNSLVLGSIFGQNGASSDTQVGIGTTAPSARLHVVGASSSVNVPVAILQSSDIQVPLSFRIGATEVARTRSDSNGNLVFATLNGAERNIFFRAGDDAGTDMFIQSSSGNIGIGNTAPATRLDVSGSISLDVSAGSGVALCRDGSRQIVDCSASSARYKQNIFGLRPGLDVVRRLRPVSFTWKQDGQRDIGLVAEEVNRVEPLLTTRNDKGEVEGVRYDRLGVVLLNAVREQQQQLEAQQLTVKQHKGQIVAQQQQLQQKHLQIEKLERRLALLEAAIKKLGPDFDKALDHRTEVGIRSRAQRSRTTRR